MYTKWTLTKKYLLDTLSQYIPISFRERNVRKVRFQYFWYWKSSHNLKQYKTDGYIVVFRNQSWVIDSWYSLLSVGKASDDNFINDNKAPIPKVQYIQILSIEQCKILTKHRQS